MRYAALYHVSMHELHQALERVRLHVKVEERLALDPVGVLHRFADPLDREVFGLVASGIAFGNVKTIRAKLEEIARRVGPHPARAADDPKALRRAMRGFRHRVFTGDHITRVLVGARVVQKRHGTLGSRFKKLMGRGVLEWRTPLEQDGAELREALAQLCDEIREAGGLEPCHILPDPRAGSAVKRLMLYLRWMVRPDDGVDLGQWGGKGGIPTSALLIPVDTHVHKLGRNLGLTDRNDLSWKTAEEVTAGLRRFAPDDPVKYDFSLCHLGMLQRCPSRRDPKRCDGCPVMPVCRHWQHKS